jgi:hypothetical protein
MSLLRSRERRTKAIIIRFRLLAVGPAIQWLVLLQVALTLQNKVMQLRLVQATIQLSFRMVLVDQQLAISQGNLKTLLLMMIKKRISCF